MWKLKSNYEIESEKLVIQETHKARGLSRALKTGIWTFVIAFIGYILLSLTVEMDYSPYREDSGYLVKPNEILEYLPEYIQRATYWGVAFFIIRLIRPKLFRDISNTYMCAKCNKTKEYDSKMTCECGGVFHVLDNFEWIEEKEDLFIPDLSWIEKYKVTKNEG